MSAVVGPGDGFRLLPTERTWTLTRAVLQTWMAPAMQLRVYGRDRLPRSGPCVLASNHIAGIDPIVLGFASPRALRYMTKSELYAIPVLRRVLPHTGAFPVRRGQADREAIRAARDVLRAGHVLGVFVEGSRQQTDAIGAARTGAAMIAVMEGAPVVPVCIQGTDRQHRNPFHPATVAFGTPIDVRGVRRGGRGYARLAEAIESELHRLRDFIHATERAGRPRTATPPTSRPLEAGAGG